MCIALTSVAVLHCVQRRLYIADITNIQNLCINKVHAKSTVTLASKAKRTHQVKARSCSN